MVHCKTMNRRNLWQNRGTRGKVTRKEEHLINAIHHKLLERHDEQADRYSAIQNSANGWNNKLTILDKYSAYCDKLVPSSESSEHLGCPLGLIRVAQHRMELVKTDSAHSYSAPYRAGLKARRFEEP